MLLCQKIGSTGSGIVVKELVDHAEAADADYALVCGGYRGDDEALLLRRRPLGFEQVVFKSRGDGSLGFPIVGMSNRMPYESMAFKDLTFPELDAYAEVWARTIRRAVKAFRPDVIHVHHLWLLAALAALEAPRVPILVSIHGTDLFRADDAPHLKRLVAPWAFRFDRIVALTDDSAEQARARYRLGDGAVDVVGNGFNAELFHPGRTPDPDLLRRYHVPSLAGTRVVATVAKFDRTKGIEWLLRAFAQSRRSGLPPCRLVVAGSGPEDERQRYLALVDSLGIGKEVSFTGPVEYEHVGSLLNAADVFCLASFHEPYGLAALEALACGCRIVITDQGGLPSVVPQTVRDHGDALVIEGLDSLEPDARAAERFVHVLAAAVSTQLARPLTAAARRRIAKSVGHLTWDAHARRIGASYRRLRLEAVYDAIAAHAARVPQNTVPTRLCVKLRADGGLSFPPAGSLAVQSLVPASSDAARAIERTAREYAERFPELSSNTFWQPHGTLHLNVVVLRRLMRGTLSDDERREVLARASRPLEWLAGVRGFDVEMKGLLLASDGTLMARGYPHGDSAWEIRKKFVESGFRDQQPMFHVTFGRILRKLPPTVWRSLVTFTERERRRDLGTVEVRQGLLVDEREGYLHAPSSYDVLRRFDWRA